MRRTMLIVSVAPAIVAVLGQRSQAFAQRLPDAGPPPQVGQPAGLGGN